LAAHLKLTAIEELGDGGGRIAPESAGAANTNCPPHRLHQPAFKIKGTVSRNGFGGFWWHVWLVIGLNKGRGQFFKFFGAPMILYCKKCILAVNVRLPWLNKVVGVYLVQVSLLIIGQQGLEIFSGIGPWFPLAGGLCKFYANARGTQPTQRQILFVQYKQQANPFQSTQNFTPLVIRRNDKNKQLTLLRQRKLARNTLFAT
jgi:hypothetical protein